MIDYTLIAILVILYLIYKWRSIDRLSLRDPIKDREAIFRTFDVETNDFNHTIFYTHKNCSRLFTPKIDLYVYIGQTEGYPPFLRLRIIGNCSSIKQVKLYSDGEIIDVNFNQEDFVDYYAIDTILDDANLIAYLQNMSKCEDVRIQLDCGRGSREEGKITSTQIKIIQCTFVLYHILENDYLHK